MHVTESDQTARVWSFETAESREMPQLRLGCAQLAYRLHLDGLQDSGATVLETARQLAGFVEGSE
ncbi:hypothetical protein SEA_STINSON_1 [Mycobacterium phage Stinson]|uniref:Gene 1 ring forming protein domain-containing protein n=1 Tax=Mycobacterium phage LaterM TaxID=2094136 RepID=A0A2P1JYV4_9CAUD|nr:hypothetical protein I5H00_gp01 [Mycobacterium phage LaterM]AVO25515.1 hypothetical protein SEA_LATERM_1 [Mycobacterium phage LaterM]QWK51338.1 hypothetical protein SEA_STINSON_1 [Mycobacterium phage Stinson]